MAAQSATLREIRCEYHYLSGVEVRVEARPAENDKQTIYVEVRNVETTPKESRGIGYQYVPASKYDGALGLLREKLTEAAPGATITQSVQRQDGVGYKVVFQVAVPIHTPPYHKNPSENSKEAPETTQVGDAIEQMLPKIAQEFGKRLSDAEALERSLREKEKLRFKRKNTADDLREAVIRSRIRPGRKSDADALTAVMQQVSTNLSEEEARAYAVAAMEWFATRGKEPSDRSL